jgi:hypothetical protein
LLHDDLTTAPNHEQDDSALSHDALHDATGAYILGALPDDERIAFKGHLRDCLSCQQELRELGPIAALLPRLYDDLDLPGIDSLPLDLDASAGVRDRIVAEAATLGAAGATTTESAELVELDVDSSGVETVDESVEAAVPEAEAPVVAAVAAPVVDDEALAAQVAADEAAEDAAVVVAAPTRRPRGRIAPGEAPPEANIVSLPKQRSSIVPWAIAAAAAIIAAGSILWALAMMGQVDDLQDERDAQDQQIAQLTADREAYLAQTSANVYPLNSTTSGSSDARAIVYMDPDPEGWGGIVAFRGMSQPPAGQVYQLWMFTDDQPTPGPTFIPDQTGEALVQVPEEAASSQAMAITMEPDGGSETPSTTPIMQGDLTA